MSVKSRQEKIEAAVPGVVMGFADYKNRRSFGLPGSQNGDRYRVEVYWEGSRTVTNTDITYTQANCQCHKIVANTSQNLQGRVNCQGNEKWAICYHVLASLKAGAEAKGKQIAFFDVFSQAQLYSNLGGKLIRIDSIQGKGIAWAVVKDQRMKLVDRVNLLRGPIEEGID